MDLVAREFVSVNRAPPVTLLVASASALLASMASSVRGVSVSGPHPTPVPFPVLVNLGEGNTDSVGFTGCKPGFFGDGCLQQCNCHADVPCDPISGLCLCPPGRTGATCDLGECGLLPRMGCEGRSTLTANINHVGWLPACQASD